MWNHQIRVHLLFGDSSEHVGVVQVPKHVDCFCLEVWDALGCFFDCVQHIAVACVINTDTSCTCSVREDFDERVLPYMFCDEGAIFNKVVQELAGGVNH